MIGFFMPSKRIHEQLHQAAVVEALRFSAS
jgi:hypothetical protein